MLKELAHLEKQHDKHRLGKLHLSTRQETDAQGSDGRYRHQEIFIEQIPFNDTLSRLLKSSETNQEIWHKIYDK